MEVSIKNQDKSDLLKAEALEIPFNFIESQLMFNSKEYYFNASSIRNSEERVQRFLNEVSIIIKKSGYHKAHSQIIKFMMFTILISWFFSAIAIICFDLLNHDHISQNVGYGILATIGLLILSPCITQVLLRGRIQYLRRELKSMITEENSKLLKYGYEWAQEQGSLCDLILVVQNEEMIQRIQSQLKVKQSREYAQSGGQIISNSIQSLVVVGNEQKKESSQLEMTSNMHGSNNVKYSDLCAN